MNREIERQRLVELLKDGHSAYIHKISGKSMYEELADYLLDRGVVVQHCEDDDDVNDVAQDVFVEPLYLTMTNEEVNEVIDRCRRRVVEESGCTDL